MTNSQPGDVVVLPSIAEIADQAAQRVAALAQAAITQRGRFRLALAGGSTPQALHQQLAGPALSAAIDWERVQVYWGDERVVPPDHAESNFRMARETLLAHVPIPAANIFPVPTIGGTPADAAHAYAETLTAEFGADLPRFDVILLGMGPDGHTASLFPGQPEPTRPGDALVIAVGDAPKPPPDRVSFSYRLINAARVVLFLVAGADKAGVLAQVLQGPLDQARLPAQGVRPNDGELIWLIDSAAAGALVR